MSFLDALRLAAPVAPVAPRERRPAGPPPLDGELQDPAPEAAPSTIDSPAEAVADAPEAAPDVVPAIRDRHLGPGLVDVEAAAALVEAGISRTVRIVGLRPWPGALSQVAAVAERRGVRIVAVRSATDEGLELLVGPDEE